MHWPSRFLWSDTYFLDLHQATFRNSYPAIDKSAGKPSPADKRRIISSDKGRTRLSTSATRARMPMYGSRSFQLSWRASITCKSRLTGSTLGTVMCFFLYSSTIKFNTSSSSASWDFGFASQTALCAALPRGNLLWYR